MPKSRIPYPPEFRQQMVELVRSGRSPGSLAKEFGPSAQTIHTWVKQADLDSGRRHYGLTTTRRSKDRLPAPDLVDGISALTAPIIREIEVGSTSIAPSQLWSICRRSTMKGNGTNVRKSQVQTWHQTEVNPA